jgi:hypothetical protein
VTGVMHCVCCFKLSVVFRNEHLVSDVDIELWSYVSNVSSSILYTWPLNSLVSSLHPHLQDVACSTISFFSILVLEFRWVFRKCRLRFRPAFIYVLSNSALVCSIFSVSSGMLSHKFSSVCFLNAFHQFHFLSFSFGCFWRANILCS